MTAPMVTFVSRTIRFFLLPIPPPDYNGSVRTGILVSSPMQRPARMYDRSLTIPILGRSHQEMGGKVSSKSYGH